MDKSLAPFKFDELPPLQQMHAEPFYNLAERVVQTYAEGKTRTSVLKKLLEARNLILKGF